MVGGEGTPAGDEETVALDRAAEHVIAARALVMTLPADRREDLRAVLDILLRMIGVRLAAGLPPSSAIDAL